MRAICRLVFREVGHRWGNFLLGCVAVAAAVLACVALAMTHEATGRETRRVTRDLGFNLRIVPRSTDMENFWHRGFSQDTMPEETVERLAARSDISYNHLVATLQRNVRIGDCDVLLTGLSDEFFPPGMEKPPMVRSVEPGTVHVGFEIANRLDLRAGETISIAGREWRVVRCAPETGTRDDMRVIGRLEDVQQALGEPGRINEIQAIDCLCLSDDKDPLGILRGELERALPEAKLVFDRVKADKRARQRQMVQRVAPYMVGGLLAVSAVWIGTLAFGNVRQRAGEIGLLRALGYGSAAIAAMILARAVMLGVMGAVLGFAAGTALAIGVAPELFPETARSVRADWRLLWWALVAAPAFAALASVLPAMVAVTQDPALTLQQNTA